VQQHAERLVGHLMGLHYKFTAEFVGERILKISQHNSGHLWANVTVTLFDSVANGLDSCTAVYNSI